MSKSKIVGRCPTIEAPLREGLNWRIFPRRVADLYPNFTKLAQAALNIVGNVQQAMGEFDVLKEVAVKAAEQMKSNPQNAVNWKTIQQQIVCQKTSVEPEGVVDIVNYVQKWGGGREMFYVKVLHKFHKILGKSQSARASRFLRLPCRPEIVRGAYDTPPCDGHRHAAGIFQKYSQQV